MKKRVIRGLLAAMLLLTGCSDETPGAEIPETSDTAQAESQPMFTDVQAAEAKIRELTGLWMNPDLLEPEGYEAFMTLAEECTALLAQENPDPEEYCRLAEELVHAYDGVEYQRGDTPRVYLNTVVYTPNFALGAAVVDETDASAALAVDGDSKTFWQPDET